MRPNLILYLSAIVNVAAAADVAVDEGESHVVVQIDPDIEVLPLNSALAVASPEELFRLSCPEEAANPGRPRVLGSSYDVVQTDAFERREVFASSSSFVRGAIEAWARHQHLVLRPDEVWFEILAQLNFYMEKNAEKVREVFVSHEGKERIVVGLEKIAQTDIEAMITSFEQALKKMVRASWLSDWIKPGFTTSSVEDELTATVLMMGLMQQYTDFGTALFCGLPSVSLLGTKDDWVSLRRKLDDLPKFGEEPAEYARVLTPILDGFVNTWDNKDSPDTKEFWSQIVSGVKNKFVCGIENVISGWITGFYFWNGQGEMILTREQREKIEPGAVLGGINYWTVSAEKLPVSYAKVPVNLISEGIDAYLLAGNVGVSRTMASDGRPVAEPMSGWYLYGPVNEDYKFGGQGGNREELRAVKGLLDQCLPDGYRPYGEVY